MTPVRGKATVDDIHRTHASRLGGRRINHMQEASSR